MKSIVKTLGALASAVANSIALSQTPSAALTLNGALVSGGVAILSAPARITITPASDESGKTFTVTGTDASGNTITETMAGTNATLFTSKLTYKTITAISISSAAAGAVTVGNSQSGSVMIALDSWAHPQVGLQISVTGTVNYTVQSSFDNPNDPVNPVALASMQWVDSSDSAVVSATATKQSSFAYAPLWMRVVLNSGSGSLLITAVQYSVTPI